MKKYFFVRTAWIKEERKNEGIYNSNSDHCNFGNNVQQQPKEARN